MRCLTYGSKELRSLMDSVLSIDQDLVVGAIRTHALQTLQLYASGAAIKWNDAELAIYLIFIYGEINKSLFASHPPPTSYRPSCRFYEGQIRFQSSTPGSQRETKRYQLR